MAIRASKYEDVWARDLRNEGRISLGKNALKIWKNSVLLSDIILQQNTPKPL
jgi:hypothetical protein